MLADFIGKHLFQPDYYQFYFIVLVGFLYLEHKFRGLKKNE